ncbi:phosphocholine cytidylyltransferase family protein [Candidatus Sumerlaeota bacterium]|nr:phosphocholine cytidylyltransferase family protein [Candidatus Sumerlaeota bacterium]
MKAVILAAGQGKRLLPLTDNRPKCLLPLGESTFIEFQLDSLRRAGVGEVAIVTGYCADQVRGHCGSSCTYFQNNEFDSTNSLYSFMLAAEFAREGCLVLNSDVVFHPEILRRLLDAPTGNTLLVDFAATLAEEEMKVVCDGQSRITAISKSIPAAEADGENLGMIRMDATGAQAVLGAAHEAARAGERRLWAPQGVARVLDTVPFYALGIEGLPWTEVDFPDDLTHAQEDVYPLCCP